MENNDNYKLKPNILFWEKVFSSFITLKKFSKNFLKEIKGKDNEELPPLTKLFADLLHKKITVEECPKEFMNIIISKNKQYLFKDPKKLFNFLLEELHNELKDGDEKNNNDIQINNNKNEDNKEKSYKYFLEYQKKNKSYIEKLFFGVREIQKDCQVCKNSFYEYNFLKFCPMSLEKISGFIEIEDLYDNIQRDFEKDLFCNKCQKKQKFRIKITIKAIPKILTFFFFNYKKKVKIDFSLFLQIRDENEEIKEKEKIEEKKEIEEKEKTYILRSFIMGNNKSNILKKIFFCKKNYDDEKNINYISYRRSHKKYYNNEKENKEIGQKVLNEGNPYLLFYVENNDKKNEIDDKTTITSDGSQSNDQMLNPKKAKYNTNIANDKLDDKFDENNNKSFYNTQRNKIVFSSRITFNEKPKNMSMNSNINKNMNINELIDNENTEILLKTENPKKNEIINNKQIELKNYSINTNTNILIDSNDNNKETESKIIKNESFEAGENTNYIKANKSIESNLDDEPTSIRLYFKFKDNNNNNVYFLDTENNLTFDNIIKQLKEENGDISLEELHLSIDGKIIANDKTPQNLGIEDGTYINVN